ncbi:hypothetical protein F0562_035951 [Nyssa sinensis]|uniref:Uncharacterized protein n=1 Tax=Nyssa sinensis TaxID=561372 RepID=A0A5J5AFW2_9ASTE|nr:hypothetical protein F0562_035951 [Nyssa sinensis]
MRPSMMEVAAELEQIRLSRWTSSEENITALSETSSCSSSSNLSEKPLSLTIKKPELDGRALFALQIGAGSMNSMDMLKETSPVSVQDPWLSNYLALKRKIALILSVNKRNGQVFSNANTIFTSYC